MRKLDMLTVLVLVFSVFFFIKSDNNASGPTKLNVIEGNAISGGRIGFAELTFNNVLSGEIECNVSTRVYNSGLAYENNTLVVFPPGISQKRLRIFLPDGDNEVKADVKC